jgi:hypothetical protein
MMVGDFVDRASNASKVCSMIYGTPEEQTRLDALSLWKNN